MALRNEGKSAPKFESEEGGVATETAAVEASAPAAAATETAAPAAAVAVRPPAGALANALRRATALDASEGVIELTTLETMGIGAFPRITVDQGGFSENKTKFLGSGIKIEVLSWNYVTLITTGEKDDKEADKLIRSSYDHVNIPGEGKTVDAYMAELREQGYDKTASKKYVEIYANLLWSEKGGAVAPEDVKMVQLSVSPQSVKQWQRHLLESKMRAARGLEITAEVSIAAERVVNGSNTYGVMQFGAKL